jgi:hypothetical protein
MESNGWAKPSESDLMGLDVQDRLALTFVCRNPVAEGFADGRFENLKRLGLAIIATLLDVEGEPCRAWFPTEEGLRVRSVLIVVEG